MVLKDRVPREQRKRISVFVSRNGHSCQGIGVEGTSLAKENCRGSGSSICLFQPAQALLISRQGDPTRRSFRTLLVAAASGVLFFLQPALIDHRQVIEVGEREESVAGGGRRLSQRVEVACT